MLEMILSHVVSALGGALDLLIAAFLDLMVLDVDKINEDFPALYTGYEFFQAVAIGLIFLIAIFHLYLFHTGRDDYQDRPLGILVRSGLAAFMVWFGAYFLEILVDLAQLSYHAMVNADYSELPSFSELAVDFLTLDWGMETAALALSTTVVLTVCLFLILIIGWNCLKLMIEVCERYLMVMICFYASPLAFSTLSTRATSGIFNKFFSMFCGQCALMTLSAWFMKLILSGFAFSADSSALMLRLLLTLALCKIAQRMDSYLQQLGIGVAMTGGNLLGETMATLSYLHGKFGGPQSQGTKGTSVLGEQNEGTMSRVGGVLGGISNAAQKGYQQYQNGDYPEDIGSNLYKNFRQGFAGKDPINKYFVKKYEEGLGFESSREDVSKAAVQGNRAFYENVKSNKEKYMHPAGAGHENSPIDGDVVKSAADAKKTYEQYIHMQRMMNGVGGMERGEDGIRLNKEAREAGLTFKDYNYNEADNERSNGDQIMPFDNEVRNIVEGPDEQVGDFLANNYNTFADDPEMNAVAIETVNNGSHLAVEQMVSNPYTDTLKGNDELGDAVIKKMFGENNVTGRVGGKFSNVRIETTASGGRIVKANYKWAGQTSSYEIMDEKTREKAPIDGKTAFEAGVNFGIRNRSDALQMNSITSKSTGAKWYAIRTEARVERMDLNAPNIAGSSGTKNDSNTKE